MTAAVDALVSIQRSDGAFVDFDLPVGESTEWVTAFVGASLTEASITDQRSEALSAAARAATFLAQRRAYDAGWGFNAATGADADSTAHALILLRRVGADVRPIDFAFLASHRLGHGSRTFLRDDGWGMPHADVTAVAIMAFPIEMRPPLLMSLAKWLGPGSDLPRPWPAYWWDLAFYTPYVVADLFSEAEFAGEESWMIFEGRHAYRSLLDAIVALGYVTLTGADALVEDALLEIVLSAQRSSGLFPPSEALLVPEPHCTEPWKQFDGCRYADVRGVYSTAMAVRVLSRCMEAMASPESMTGLPAGRRRRHSRRDDRH